MVGVTALLFLEERHRAYRGALEGFSEKRKVAMYES
jgi:hypothetical protein